jgi:hypothetical protein
VNEDDSRRLSITAAISLAAHAAVALALVLSPSLFPRVERVFPNLELTVEIEPTRDEVVASPPPPPDEPPTPELARGARSLERRTTRAVVREPVLAIVPDALEPTPEPAEPSANSLLRETDEQRRERLRMLLDPSTVARGGFVLDEPNLAATPARREAARPTAAELGAALSASLRRDAMAGPNGRRPAPVLRARTDGTQVYAGHAFSATILADGSVQFDDRPNVQLNSFPVGFTFDVTDAVMRASGQDPYAAERAWFMRETQALRDRLEAEARAQARLVGQRRLRGRIALIEQDESLTEEQRRRALSALQAEVEPDEPDAGAR